MRRAGRLAGVLAGLGAGPEAVVAVVMERSAGLVAALLGVLKAGAAYLPVDPGYPAERIAFMLADARPGGGGGATRPGRGWWPAGARCRWLVAGDRGWRPGLAAAVPAAVRVRAVRRGMRRT